MPAHPIERGYPICPRCHRPILFPITTAHVPCDTGITAYLVHTGYGCDTGCCGHHAYLLDTTGAIVASDFSFSHPFGEAIDAFIRETIHRRWPWATIDYTKCEVLDD
jgi:hypothetical protein